MMEQVHLDSGVAQDAVRLELGAILASPEFKASRRCQDFLKFVVERTIAGVSEGLKERTIGIEVFGRPPSYDTSADGIVRLNASEVRKRLAIYYADPAQHPELRISLPVGSYVPQFSRIEKAPGNGTLAHASDASLPGPVLVNGIALPPETLHNLKPRRRLVFWTVAIVLVAALASVRWFDLRPSQTIVDQFWQPLLQAPGPILIVPAYVPVYAPASDTPAYVPGSNALPSVLSASITPRHDPFTLLTDQYVGGGDLVAAVQVSSMLMRLRHPINLRMSAQVSLDDLRNTPTVLIGYSSTQWADVTNKFRFFVDDSTFGMIRDNGKPTDWYPHHETLQHHTDEDYAVISRAFDPETRSMLILISGCMQYGTEGAARLITSPELLSAALRGAPKDWQQKNIQLVIQLDVVANSPASSKVVAAYYW
jgi:hypothetical protein